MIRLVIKDSEGGEASCPVLSEVLIGRSTECHIRLNNRGVSRKHARIFIKDATHFIEDLQTANGTRVNGELISKITPIRPGDLIQLVGEKIRVLEITDADSRSKEETTISHRQEIVADEQDETKDPVKLAWRAPIEPRAALLKTEKIDVDFSEVEELARQNEKRKKMLFILAGGGALLVVILFFYLMVKL